MSRKACCLCKDAEAALFHAVGKGLCPAEAISVVDVDEQLELAALYGADVPVLVIDGVVTMKHVFKQSELEERLAMLSEDGIKC